MIRSLIISSILAVSGLATAAPTGTYNLDLSPSGSDGRLVMDLEHEGNMLSGSIHSGGSPFVSLKRGEGGWQGRFGDQNIASTKVENKGDGKYEVTISALPAGIFMYEYRIKSDGSVRINGSGPRGNLNSAQINSGASKISFGNNAMSFEMKQRAAGRYEGSLSISYPYFDSGYASLRVAGTLAPSALMQDAALYTLLYAFPFSN